MRVAHEIMSECQHQMVALTLLPGDKGIFDVKVNGTLIYSKHATGRFPEPG
ncbi:MAG: selenoprotein, partial [Actinobacteria bacterium]|nr:selenoprotein [Actinomycetota bacterium]